MSERKVYQQLGDLIKNEGAGDGVVELVGDGGKKYVVSQGKNDAIVVSGGGEENIVLPNGEQIFVRSN
ncbi:MAG: hypothetical protein CH104c_0442 [Candidatus Woesebacteria bacterium]|nr:MAG: hypothetical protein CH104c_0442 [Candidatus Woesebacteria bacterium]